MRRSIRAAATSTPLLLIALGLGCALGQGPDELTGGGGSASQAGPGGGESGATATSSSSSGASGSSSSSSSSGEPECPYDGPPPLDPSTLPACPGCDAAGAHCLPEGLVPPEFLDQLADCDPGNKCVPDDFILTQGLFIPPTCSSIAGMEGRCLSRCLPQVAAQAAMLPVDICADGQVCTPCYDPISGDPTGACTLSCDPGPTEPPTTLPKCCDGQGTCVPPASAGNQADQLGEEGCPQDHGALLCAPDVFVNDPSWKPPACETSLLSFLFGDDYKPGACLPKCIPAVDNFLVQQDGCPDGMKCAPCLSPPFGQPSGACEL